MLTRFSPHYTLLTNDWTHRCTSDALFVSRVQNRHNNALVPQSTLLLLVTCKKSQFAMIGYNILHFFESGNVFWSKISLWQLSCTKHYNNLNYRNRFCHDSWSIFLANYISSSGGNHTLRGGHKISFAKNCVVLFIRYLNVMLIFQINCTTYKKRVGIIIFFYNLNNFLLQ